MKLCQISSCILILLATIYVTSSQYFCNFSQNFLGDLQLTLQQVWNVSLNQTASAKGLCVVMVLGTRRIKTYAIIRVCMHLFVPKLNLRNGINSSVTKKKKRQYWEDDHKAALSRQLLDLLNKSIYLGLYLFEDLFFRGSRVLLDKFCYGKQSFIPIRFNLFFSGQLLPQVLEEPGADHCLVEFVCIFDFLQRQEQANLLQQIATVS